MTQKARGVDGEYRDALDTVNRIQRLSDDHWRVLDPSCDAMDDDAWVGPAGRQFKQVVHAQRNELRAQLTRAVDDARSVLPHLAGRA
jgi:hypothetical protein